MCRLLLALCIGSPWQEASDRSSHVHVIIITGFLAAPTAVNIWGFATAYVILSMMHNYMEKHEERLR